MSKFEFLEKPFKQDAVLDFLHKTLNFDEFLVGLPIEDNNVKELKQLGVGSTNEANGNSKKIAVFIVVVKPSTKIDRNRVDLRKVVLQQVKQEASDGALAVYVDAKTKQWRLSFIAIQAKFVKGELILAETASKGYTYSLGEGTKTDTASKQLGQLNKSSSIEEITDAFATEPLNKEFYNKIYAWYEGACKKVQFPNDEHAKDYIQIALIRLLTRLLFIWFIKERQLVNPELFVKKELQEIIHWHKPSSYYKAILQNLFFATLNREIDERSFRTTTKKGKADGNNYLVGNIYRYQEFFVGSDKDAIIGLFAQTPFLNGGLFECLDRNATEPEERAYDKDKHIRKHRSAIRIDGFSDRDDNQLNVPNELFFADENGLINLLNQYQFTATESTSSDIEVALEPELLGKIFENLLASYNPETQEQARKATGSFYTPREIVDYMVDASLKQYLIQQVDSNKQCFRACLDKLFSIAQRGGELPQDQPLIQDNEAQALIQAISQVKILDPAVGSGAFIMGALQKMTALIAILDPDNERWKKQKLTELPELRALEKDLITTGKRNDKDAKQQAKKILQEKQEAVLAQFENQDYNYLRKLYLIENCLYGVDIQIIAITIVKLRFFISLAIEQSSNDNAQENYGITALPNLETKLIASDSLIGLNNKARIQFNEKSTSYTLRSPDIEGKEEELKKIRSSYFSAKTVQTKAKYRKEDKRLRQEIATLLETENYFGSLIAQKIANWNPYSQNETTDWFNPEWQFGVTRGFDIVIGNPPYIQLQKNTGKLADRYAEQNYATFARTGDIYALFYTRGHELLGEDGHLCFITSNKWMRAGYGKKLRNYFSQYTQPQILIDLGPGAFETATVDTNILLFAKKPQQLSMRAKSVTSETGKNLYDSSGYIDLPVPEINANWLLINHAERTIKAKIEKIGVPLKDWDVEIYRGITTGYNKAFIIDTAKKDKLVARDPNSAEIINPILRGKNIDCYKTNWDGEWLINAHNGYKINKRTKVPPIDINDYPAIKGHLDCYWDSLKNRGAKGKTPYNLRSCAYILEFEKEKIIFARIVKNPQFVLDKNKYCAVDTALIMVGNHLKYILALLNSNFVYKIFYGFYSGGGIDGEIKIAKIINLPIPKLTAEQQVPFIKLVDEIQLGKANGQDTIVLEDEIDNMVYALYDMTAEEIKIIKTIIVR